MDLEYYFYQAMKNFKANLVLIKYKALGHFIQEMEILFKGIGIIIY